jgi:flavin-binding protein dodecin
MPSTAGGERVNPWSRCRPGIGCYPYTADVDRVAPMVRLPLTLPLGGGLGGGKERLDARGSSVRISPRTQEADRWHRCPHHRDQRDVYTSFEDAIAMGIERAHRTLRNLRSAWIHEQRVEIEDGGVARYQVNMLVRSSSRADAPTVYGSFYETDWAVTSGTPACCGSLPSNRETLPSGRRTHRE